jgi:hypothetical protein
LRRRPRWALGPGRSRRSHRPRRALRAGRSRWPRRPRRTGFPLGTRWILAAISDANQYSNDGDEPREAHRILTIVSHRPRATNLADAPGGSVIALRSLQAVVPVARLLSGICRPSCGICLGLDTRSRRQRNDNQRGAAKYHVDSDEQANCPSSGAGKASDDERGHHKVAQSAGQQPSPCSGFADQAWPTTSRAQTEPHEFVSSAHFVRAVDAFPTQTVGVASDHRTIPATSGLIRRRYG